MNWNPKTWRFNWKGDKERWIILLALGLIFLILAVPSGKKNVTTQSEVSSGGAADGRTDSGYGGEEDGRAGSGYGGTDADGLNDSLTSASLPAATASAAAYERRLEERLTEILSRVDGVGEVEVMVVLRSSEERVWLTDRDTGSSTTRETDSGGGSRQIQSQEVSEETVLTGQRDSAAPVLRKEVYPEIGGVVVSAAGGASPVVQAEISAAVEALFGVPSHKIKILKRVE